MELLLIFLTGLTVGGLTCLAVQGSLLAAVISAREKENKDDKESLKEALIPTISFLAAKLITYTLLGFFLGLLGQKFSFSDNLQIAMQFIAGIYILAVAMNLLNVHPIFRYVIFQPPKFITKKIRKTPKREDIFAPAILGFMTIFIPCGTTLAMETLALSRGNPIEGALIMGVYVLGTIPVFFGLGFLTAFFGATMKSGFLKFAAIVLIFLGFNSINGALKASGYNFSLNDSPPLQNSNPVDLENGVQTVNINVYPNGYSPNKIKVKAGIPVKVNLSAKNGIGCASAFRIPSLGIKKDIFETGEGTVEFTPQNPGRIDFTCSMGMYSGYFEVI